MAGDWIKIEHSLPGKPEVMELARILAIDELAVVGHLVCFWSWVDQNLSPECPAATGTKRGLDRVAGRDGFVDAMVTVGWLQFDGHSVTIPNYDHHLSESAKKRAVEARKKQRQRKRPQKCPDDNGTNEGQNRGPEKRREEITTCDVVIPEKLNAQTAQTAAAKWFGYLLKKGCDDKVPESNSPQMQAFWDDHARHLKTPEAFCEAIDHSMANGWKTITRPRSSGKKTGSNGHQSGDWVQVQKALSIYPTDWEKRKEMLGPELAEALKRTGTAKVRDANDFELKTLGEVFESHLADIRKAGNGSAP